MFAPSGGGDWGVCLPRVRCATLAVECSRAAAVIFWKPDARARRKDRLFLANQDLQIGGLTSNHHVQAPNYKKKARHECRASLIISLQGLTSCVDDEQSYQPSRVR